MKQTSAVRSDNSNLPLGDAVLKINFAGAVVSFGRKCSDRVGGRRRGGMLLILSDRDFYMLTFRAVLGLWYSFVCLQLYLSSRLVCFKGLMDKDKRYLRCWVQWYCLAHLPELDWSMKHLKLWISLNIRDLDCFSCGESFMLMETRCKTLLKS